MLVSGTIDCMSTAPKTRRRWYQFSLGRVFHSVTLLCVAAALVAWIDAPLSPQSSSLVVLVPLVLFAATGALFRRAAWGVCIGLVSAVILAVIAELWGARP
jgi:uncharacterized membrane protein YccC